LADLRQRKRTEVPGRTLAQAVTGGLCTVAQQLVLAVAALETDDDAGGAESLQQVAEFGPLWVPK